MRLTQNSLKILISVICFLSFTFCESPQPKIDPIQRDSLKGGTDTLADAVEISEIQFSEAQLLSFLDSIGQLDGKRIEPKSVSAIDSVFRNRKQLNIDLKKKDFNLLKESAETGRINLSLAKRIFPFKIDSAFIADQEVLLEFFPFSKSNPFDEFMISIGERRATWGNDLYFFKGNTMISWHPNFCKNDNEIFHFKDGDGNTVVYYTENFSGGSGIWHYNYFFYKYMGKKLIPVLNVLQNGNQHWSGSDNRHFWFESFVKKIKPLTFKFVYNYELNNGHNTYTGIVNDSSEQVFAWDDHLMGFKEKSPCRPCTEEIYCYYTEFADIYHIHVEYARFKSLLRSHEKAKREAILVYLNKVKNDLAQGRYKD